MAQKRFRNYKNSLTSVDHNLMNLAFHPAGRYFGFDSIEPEDTLQFSLTHIQTGVKYKDTTNTLRGPAGLIMTPQGVIIMETEPLTELTIDTNAGNGSIRYDLIVCNHDFTLVSGGSDATYQIIKGPLNNPIKPIPSDPYKQTLIGIIEIPAGASNINVCKYTKMKSPDSGDGEDARLAHPNIFQAIQLWASSVRIYDAADYTDTPAGIGISQFIQFEQDGNTFKVVPTGASLIRLDGIKIKDTVVQDGTEINVTFNNQVQLRNPYGSALPSQLQADGFRPFKIHASFFTGLENGFGIVRPATGESWIGTFIFLDNQWVLVNIGGRTNSTRFVKGMMIEWYGDVSNTFDSQGTGVIGGIMEGWQICNGLNGSPDRRGLLSMMTTEVPNNGANDISSDISNKLRVNSSRYQTLGKSELTIIKANLPDYQLTVNDAGHSHTFKVYGSDSDSWRQSGGSGRPLTRIQDYATASTGPNQNVSTNSQTTGITVNLGGSSDPVQLLNPVFATVIIMKL